MVAEVYGRCKPDTEERDRWERWRPAVIRRMGAFGAPGGAVPSDEDQVLHEHLPVSQGYSERSENSRGGTRTRDPGIMSAVL